MIGEELIEEKPVSLAKVKGILSERKKDKELNYEQDIALKYAKKFAKTTPKQTEKLEAELSAIKSLTPELITKIIDVLPSQKEVMEMLVPKNADIPEEDLAKALELTKKYSKE
jgi:DNA-directed RNA polymerase subunit F